MPFPIKTCVICEEEFELRPGKPGFANRCPACSAAEAEEEQSRQAQNGVDQKGDSEINAARRKAIKDLLYRKES